MNTISRPLLAALLKEECGWVEWKHNNISPKMIGPRLSGLSNTACIEGQPYGYMLWGIADNGEVVGTTVQPDRAKIGNERLKAWLETQLHPRIELRWSEVEIDGKRVVVARIAQAHGQPTAFAGERFVRVDTLNKPLGNYPAVERALWLKLSQTSWESTLAQCTDSMEEVLAKLHVDTYTILADLRRPSTDKLEAELSRYKVIAESGGQICLTFTGALALGRNDIHTDSRILRKSLRMVHYRGPGRQSPSNRWESADGYFAIFDAALTFILNAIALPDQYTEAGQRRKDYQLPPMAIREVLANALIHQDLEVEGAGPAVAIFSNRVEISNPGTPLIPIDRLIDYPPKSRNPALATLARHLGIAEEEGKGLDTVFSLCEDKGLPAPDIKIAEHATVFTFYFDRPYADLTLNDKLRAAYQHAALKYQEGEALTNTSLRERLGLPPSATSIVSAIIRRAVDHGLLKPENAQSTSRKLSRYLPYWG